MKSRPVPGLLQLPQADYVVSDGPAHHSGEGSRREEARQSWRAEEAAAVGAEVEGPCRRIQGPQTALEILDRS